MDPGQLLNHALGWLWNNTYFSFVPLFEILAEPEVRKRILRHLPLRSLLNCCSVARELRNWALVQLRVSAHEFGPLPRRTTPHSSCGQATPLVVLVGGLTTDWSFVEVRVPSPMASLRGTRRISRAGRSGHWCSTVLAPSGTRRHPCSAPAFGPSRRHPADQTPPMTFAVRAVAVARLDLRTAECWSPAVCLPLGSGQKRGLNS